ncbi:MAG: serine/threonine-protein kinase [Spirochaetaceae bacterium]|jgi:DNA-binding helix-hairpin-helix protein with protein kinase domain|nr:serine/threonine-protein kinase [Spirochaetaceae bacterium]
MVEFQAGQRIALWGGGEALVGKLLGRGGQGAVYEVTVDGKPCALKWYTCHLQDKAAFKENLRQNIEDPGRSLAPDDKFLWPRFLTEDLGAGKTESFGYVMALRPPEFTDFPAILNGKDGKGGKVAFASTEVMILAALNLVNAFRSLHRKGLSYQDLNDGNFFINTETGDVLICDNDNVTPDGKVNSGGVGGKPGYMAPEIVRGDAHPSERTDCHSLAVVLFKLFFRHSPLQGAAYEKLPCMTEKREMELFGTNPVFVYDPDDESNRPVNGVHNNVIKLWPLFPQFFRDAFILSFAKGMKDPQVRMTDNAWQKLLVRLRDEWYVGCPSCGKAMFLGDNDAAADLQCSGCSASFSYPRRLGLKQGSVLYNIPLFPGKKLYACHIVKDSDDYRTVSGEVVMNKNNPSLWGIKNLSPETWRIKPPGGEVKEIAPGGAVPIGPGLTINFAAASGNISE